MHKNKKRNRSATLTLIDGVLDGEDDFPLDDSLNTDTDGDGRMAVDSDDDNDGISDAEENSAGTDPLNQIQMAMD